MRACEMSCAEPPSLEGLRVLHQDQDYLVIDKHWDVRIDSKVWHETLTVQTQLRHRFPLLADPGTYHGFRFCHQLDYSTSGALCVALNKAAAGRAYRCFRDRMVTKVYVALVRGWLDQEHQTLDFAIGKNSSEGKTHMMCVEGAEGCENPKHCQTELTVLAYGTYDGSPVTKVMLQPMTGRTHQLRVHCAGIGHPIVGDVTYSQGVDSAPYRMMLHAHFLLLPLEPQPLAVWAGDPFTPGTDPQWQPQRPLVGLQACVEALLEKRSREEEEERRSRAEEEEEQRRRRRSREEEKKRRGREENQEQSRCCQKWMSELADLSVE